MNVYIFAQLIGLIAFFFSIFAYHNNSKNKILTGMIISNILNMFHYYLLNASSGCTTKIVAIIRDFIIIKKEKYKFLDSNIFLYLLIVIYLGIGILTYKSIYSILPIIAASIYIFFIWNGDKIKVRKTACFCTFLWLAYNICVFSISGIISNIALIISTLVALRRDK